MNTWEKLILICEYCEYEDKYRPQNKTTSWDIIYKILKDKIG